MLVSPDDVSCVVSVDKLDVCDVDAVDLSSVVLDIVLESVEKAVVSIVVVLSVGELDIRMSVLLYTDKAVVCLEVVGVMVYSI